MLRRLAASLVLILAASPALANDPNPGDAAQTGQLGPSAAAPRDFALPEHEEAAARCWGRAAGRRGAPLTRVTAAYRVSAKGRVRDARVVEPARPSAVAKRCVLGALRANRFPPDEVTRMLGDHPEEREVRHTFVLERVEAPMPQRSVLPLLVGLSTPDGGQLADVLGSIQVSGTGLGSGEGVRIAPPRGSVHTADPTVRGTLAPAVVRRVLQASLGRFRACYERALAGSPALAGRLDAHVVIDAQGTVTHATLAPGGPADAAMRRCMVTGLRLLRFPSPEGGSLVVADFPLTLAP